MRKDQEQVVILLLKTLLEESEKQDNINKKKDIARGEVPQKGESLITFHLKQLIEILDK